MIRSFRCALCALAAGLVGCSDAPKTGTVAGKVTLNAKPVPNAVVSFVAKTGGTPVAAVTGEDGDYTAADAPAGEVFVTVRPNAGESAQVGEGVKKTGQGASKTGHATVAAPKSDIPERYADPGKSGLTTTVKPVGGGETKYDIPLTK